APAERARLLRSSSSRSPRAASGPGARIRPRGLLLLSLLVRRTPASGAPVPGSASREDAGFPLLPLLGERELVPPVGWLGARDPHRTAAFPGRRPRAHPGTLRGVRRRAVHPRGGQTAL